MARDEKNGNSEIILDKDTIIISATNIFVGGDVVKVNGGANSITIASGEDVDIISAEAKNIVLNAEATIGIEAKSTTSVKGKEIAIGEQGGSDSITVLGEIVKINS